MVALRVMNKLRVRIAPAPGFVSVASILATGKKIAYIIRMTAVKAHADT